MLFFRAAGGIKALGRGAPLPPIRDSFAMVGPAAAQPHSSHEDCWVQTSRLMPKGFLFSYLQGIRLESSAGNVGTPSSKS